MHPVSTISTLLGEFEKNSPKAEQKSWLKRLFDAYEAMNRTYAPKIPVEKLEELDANNQKVIELCQKHLFAEKECQKLLSTAKACQTSTYSNKLQHIFKETPEAWKEEGFCEKYSKELNNVKLLRIEVLTPELLSFLNENCPKIEHLIILSERGFCEKHSAELNNITSLSIKDVSIEFLSFLGKYCPKIESLGFWDDIEDRHLEALPKTIKSLNLRLCFGFTPDGLRHCATLPNLNELALGSDEITDEHLLSLTFCKHLVSLGLSCCDNITDQGMKHVARLNLESLDLSRCDKLTDEGLKNLFPLKNLASLKLRDNRDGITDIGVSYLIQFEKLSYLDLSACYGIRQRKSQDMKFLQRNTIFMAVGLI